MKTKLAVMICIIVFAFSFLNREYTSAQSSSPISKIGVVNVERVLMECDAMADYREQVLKERQALIEQQEKIRLEILALERELNSGAFKLGSEEFFTKNREIAEKEALLNFPGDFSQQELALKSQIWQIDLYKKIMKIAEDIGKEKDLYLVLSVEDPEVSPQSPDDFILAVRTHKVLYSGSGMDLTEMVMSRLNEQK